MGEHLKEKRGKGEERLFVNKERSRMKKETEPICVMMREKNEMTKSPLPKLLSFAAHHSFNGIKSVGERVCVRQVCALLHKVKYLF